MMHHHANLGLRATNSDAQRSSLLIGPHSRVTSLHFSLFGDCIPDDWHKYSITYLSRIGHSESSGVLRASHKYSRRTIQQRTLVEFEADASFGRLDATYPMMPVATNCESRSFPFHCYFKRRLSGKEKIDKPLNNWFELRIQRVDVFRDVLR